MFEFLPEISGLVWKALFFFVALSIIVFIHELGHYLAGRWSGIKADVFSLGFGRVLTSWTDRHGTRWQIAALPVGGYVKFRGDANAASGKDGAAMEGLNEAELRQTMHGAPLWARAVTVAAGPIFNFALSILIFSTVYLSQGRELDPLTVGKLNPMPGVQELQLGDEVLAIAGTRIPNWSDRAAALAFVEGIPEEPVVDYLVRRDGAEVTVRAPYPYPAYVTRVMPRSAANDAGIKVGDLLVTVDGDPLVSFVQLVGKVEGSGGNPLALEIWRDGHIAPVTLAPRMTDEPNAEGGFDKVYRIGIAGGQFFFEPASIVPPLGEAFSTGYVTERVWGGVQQTWMTAKTGLSALWHLAAGNISRCNLSGPIGIADASGTMASQGVVTFILFVAALSTAIGFLNLLPIPVLDGGHLLFYAYEAVVGRPPSDRVLQVAMSFGLAVVLGVMIFGLANDFTC